MFTLCSKCHKNSNIPCHMACGHLFCFICLNDNSTCILCQTNTGFMPNNLPGTIKYLWVYASNHPGMWWCYDNISNELIEQLYQKKINSIDTNDGDKIKFVLSKKAEIQPIQPIQPLQPIQINIPQFSSVNFMKDSNDSNLVVNFSDDNLISNNNQPQDQLSSIIKIENQYYEIDLNKMYQYNMVDKNKKRRIKRIEVPDNISKGNMPGIKSYLSDENILGISGKLFNLK